jgi:DNA-binding CsgD family transcriptional regulator
MPARWSAAAFLEIENVPLGLRLRSGGLESKPVVSTLACLSAREQQVLRLVAEGNSSKDIAVTLDLGLQTVRGYRKTMMRKLGVNNVAGLTQVAIANEVTKCL